MSSEETGFTCPHCGGGQVAVWDSRRIAGLGNGARRRRYKCLVCDGRFVTIEVPLVRDVGPRVAVAELRRQVAREIETADLLAELGRRVTGEGE